MGVAAYHASDFAEAARELRAYRRMTGDESYRAVLADCERALGRPDNALRLVHEALDANPEPDEVVELRLVEAGARHDLNELPAALLVLEAALGGRPTPGGLGRADLGQLRLATAYADLLEEQGDGELAAEWFGAIAAVDPDDLTGVSTRFGDEDGDEDDGEDDGDDTDEQRGGAEAAGAQAEPQVQVQAPVGVEGEGATPQHELIDATGDEEFDLGDAVEPDDVEAEVAELLGEAPPARAVLEADHSRLFQEAPGQAADEDPGPGEQDPPTN
ncbi:hypothetical protein GCM10027300_38500 [Modestobacter lapidis]